MAAIRECVQRYVFDIQRRFERGNHNADGLDYIETGKFIDWLSKTLRYHVRANITPDEDFKKDRKLEQVSLTEVSVKLIGQRRLEIAMRTKIRKTTS